MNIGLEKIRIDCGTQPRLKIDEVVVAEYSVAIKDGAAFPPVTVFTDGTTYYLADGFHRYFATKAAGSPGISCDLINGTLRDAILYSLGANGQHGLQRTNADKRNAVIIMLKDLEWADWSDREIAKHCHVSHVLVANIRKELGVTKVDTKYLRDGKEQVMKQRTKSEKEEEQDTESDEHFQMRPDEQMADAVALLRAENEALSDKLAVASMDADEIQKQMAESTIKDLRAQIRMLEIELNAVKQSRDTFQAENAQLMKQVAMLQKKLKKYEDK